MSRSLFQIVEYKPETCYKCNKNSFVYALPKCILCSNLFCLRHINKCKTCSNHYCIKCMPKKKFHKENCLYCNLNNKHKCVLV